MPFRLALTGLNAATTDLTVTANNIANISTAASRARARSSPSCSPSRRRASARRPSATACASPNVSQQFTQGNIDFTDNSLDLAISGQGFFMLSDSGALAYTRAGAFQVDREGYVVNAQQQRLQVYPPLANGGFNTGG